MGKKQSYSIEKRALIVTSSSVKFSVRQIEKKLNVCKTAVHNAIMKYQNDGFFKNRKRSGRPIVTSSREDRLMGKVVTRSPMSFSKKYSG